MHAFDYTAVDFLIALHDFGVINRSQLLLVGLGLEGSPLRSGQTLPCRVFMGLHGRFGDESKAVGCVSPTALLSERARSIQDQQNQIRDQHDCSRPSYRKH